MLKLLFLWVMLCIGCSSAMTDQPRYEPLEASDLFIDGASARPLIDGTIPRGAIIDNEPLRSGQTNGSPIGYFPVEVTADLLETGQRRYNIYCAPCHGYAGYGDGIIVQRGFPAPPSFHSERLRNVAVGHFFEVITSGYGIMFDYASQLPVEERWAIAAYIRALQTSQHAPVETLSDIDLEQLSP